MTYLVFRGQIDEVAKQVNDFIDKTPLDTALVVDSTQTISLSDPGSILVSLWFHYRSRITLTHGVCSECGQVYEENVDKNHSMPRGIV